jgi:hypothetical protein
LPLHARRQRQPVERHGGVQHQGEQETVLKEGGRRVS